MNLTVTGKRIDTSPAKRLIVQGEANADVIDIGLPLSYGELDLTELTYIMRAVSTKNTLVEEECETTEGADTLTVHWRITAPFAAVDGEITLELRGVLGEDVVIKFTGDKISIAPNASGEYAPPIDVFEQAIAQMTAMLTSAQELHDSMVIEYDVDSEGYRVGFKHANEEEYTYTPNLKGTGFNPMGTYTTESELRAAHPTGEHGDQYIVGDGEPETTLLYFWSLDDDDWVSAGRVCDQGPPGEPGEQGEPGADGAPGVDGADGVSPHIDATTGRWFVGETDTGVAADTIVVSDFVSTTKSIAIMKDNTEYRFGTLTSLTCTLPETPLNGSNTGRFDAVLSFTSGATATAVNLPLVGGGIIGVKKTIGTDVVAGIFTPAPNKRYTLMVWTDGMYTNVAVSGVSTS